ncbi:MAG: hypothetical protein ACREXT_07465 [Gammaproteobacteria bacterium]
MTSTSRPLDAVITDLDFDAEFIARYRRHPPVNVPAICQRDERTLYEAANTLGIAARYTSLQSLAGRLGHRLRPKI